MNEDGARPAPNGRVIGGRYRLIERIGSGGMGTVWRASDELVGREVAVKQPRLPGDPEDEARQRAAHRLYREARAAARVEHPAAVAIHDVVVEDSLPWIVMELVRGESLHELLRRGPLGATEAARIGLAVLGALRAAHAVGIVHRDVKPANVLLGPPPLSSSLERGDPHHRVVLTDFGIAHIQGEESLTVSGEFVGSLEFIAPERMSGRGAGPASDLWSLGVLLYAAVEGWSPFRRTTLESTLAAILAADPPEPKQAGPLGSLLVRLLVKDPDRRPGADEVGAVLEAVVEGWPLPVPSGGSAEEESQDASGLREFAEDSGTVRLRNEAASGEKGGPEPEPKAEAVDGTPDPEATASPAAPSGPRRRPWPLRTVPAAVLGVLLVGGTWFTTSSFLVGHDNDDGRASHSAPTPAPLTWTSHREEKLDAVLSVPSRYELFHRQAGATDEPRLVIYEGDRVSVRLTRWDKVTEPVRSQAGLHSGYWKLTDDRAGTQYNDTSFQGYDAVLADTTYRDGDVPTRVMELFVKTDDARLYALRVKMPKGTAREKEGTAVFKGARDRLEIE
ncbi:serine/threonine-protein kinase [Streptomyces sp. NPDC057740]|uniref:serine/threonine-protein kinase n=1 Tax=Streptomyces sp. NPDC057740 TaxID=3346234 RepID=UPI00369E2357